MKLDENCHFRTISTINVKTPLLLPSFSSRGFPNLPQIHQQAQRFIPDASLVSAYDLHYERLSIDDIYASDVLFVDSGGYEIGQSINNPDDNYSEKDRAVVQIWTPELHQSVVNLLQPSSKIAVISYDNPQHSMSFEQQIATAKTFFHHHPDYASVFLYKPELPNQAYINADSVVKNAHMLAAFSVLGITEKELGASILARCRTLLQIRSAIKSNGLETPIHILGCLDPTLIVMYFLCGADIFDGLAWLRYAFVRGHILHRSTAMILQEHFDLEGEDRFYSLSNLQELRSLSESMHEFCQTGNLDTIADCIDTFPQVLEILKILNSEIKE
jgi:hypothetical protein